MPFDLGGVTPEELQVIKMAGFSVKYVHDDVTVVKECPSSLLIAFYGKSGYVLPLGLFFYLISDCLYLTGIHAATNYKELCKEGEFAEVKDKDVLCLFLVGYLGE